MTSVQEAPAGYPMANGLTASTDQLSSRRVGSSQVYGAGASRPSTAPSSVRSAGVRGLIRSPSPQQRVNVNDLDHRSIIAISQSCTEDLASKAQNKNALQEMLSANKKKKMQYDSRISKKKREVDSTVVQTMELEKKLQMVQNTNKMMTSELAGLRTDNEKAEQQVEDLRKSLKQAVSEYEKACADVERVKRVLFSYRKEINSETKNRDNVQQDLRASRTAQSLMINRLDDMEKRNRALKTCVVNTFNA